MKYSGQQKTGGDRANGASTNARLPGALPRAHPVPLGADDAQPEQEASACRLLIRSFLDEQDTADRLCRLFGPLAACEVCDAAGGGATPGVVLLLTGAAGEAACRTAMRQLRAAWPGVPQLVFTRDVAADGLARLLFCGAFDFAALPGTDGELLLRVRRAFGLTPPPAPTADSGNEPGGTIVQALRNRLIGNDPKFLNLVRRLPVMACSNANVLLLGETGTGKEVFAQAIHYSSTRANGPWVAVNCAAIPPELVENELFGHVRGAYTHAHAAREGLVREAEGGTLLLDEIDSLPLPAQAKLLRFLQDKQYRVVGSSRLYSADVRVIAASNHDLRLAVARGGFRQDLFYRLNMLSLTLPPLRERRQDIPLLASHFLEEANREAGRHLAGITPAALRCLLGHSWPGNVRELRHAIHRAVLLTEGLALQPGDIEFDGAMPADGPPQSFREAKARAVEAFERGYLEQLLLENAGNISRAARAAQKNRRAFFELLRRHEIDVARYRNTLI